MCTRFHHGLLFTSVPQTHHTGLVESMLLGDLFHLFGRWHSRHRGFHIYLHSYLLLLDSDGQWTLCQRNGVVLQRRGTHRHRGYLGSGIANDDSLEATNEQV